jgi:hypothetical protein
MNSGTNPVTNTNAARYATRTSAFLALCHLPCAIVARAEVPGSPINNQWRAFKSKKPGDEPGFYLYRCATTCNLRISAPIEGCYTFPPELSGPLSFFVVAADEAEAREAVDAYVREHCADGNEVAGWAEGRYTMEVVERGHILWNENM